MLEPENRVFSRSDGWSVDMKREQLRLKALSELGLREPETIPVFEEATQTAAHFLEVPICILGFVDQDRHWFKSAVGLSKLGLMNQLAASRQMPRHESFCTRVVESYKVVAIDNTPNDPSLVKSVLVKHYGIRSYLGVPLMDVAGNCLGAIAVMDMVPRSFEAKKIQFLELVARWCMSEFERNRMIKVTDTTTAQEMLATWSRSSGSKTDRRIIPPTSSSDSVAVNQIKLELLGQLTQELRTPLTSVLGMASVLGREIYGPLTTKQKEYLEIIQHSGRYLLSLVNELSELGTLYDSSNELNPVSVDIEMLCQQAINTLTDASNRRDQEIRLSVEPGRRIWVLDKDKVRQLVYHLVFSVIQLAATGSVIRIHVSHKIDSLNIAIGASHPWLGNGLTQIDPYLGQLLVPAISNHPEAVPYITDSQRQEQPAILPLLAAEPLLSLSTGILAATSDSSELPQLLESSPIKHSVSASAAQPEALAQLEALAAGLREATLGELYKGSSFDNFNQSRESLGLLLSCHLAELHGGQISIQGTPESGYRYMVSLPVLSAVEQSI